MDEGLRQDRILRRIPGHGGRAITTLGSSAASDLATRKKSANETHLRTKWHQRTHRQTTKQNATRCKQNANKTQTWSLLQRSIYLFWEPHSVLCILKAAGPYMHSFLHKKCELPMPCLRFARAFLLATCPPHVRMILLFSFSEGSAAQAAAFK